MRKILFLLLLLASSLPALTYVDGRMVMGMVRMSTDIYSSITNQPTGIVHTNDYVLVKTSISNHPAGIYQRLPLSAGFILRHELLSTNWIHTLQTGTLATNSVVITKFSVMSNRISAVSNYLAHSTASQTNGIGGRISAITGQTLGYNLRFINLTSQVKAVSNVAYQNKSTTNGIGPRIVSVTGQTLGYNLRFNGMSGRISYVSNIAYQNKGVTNGIGAQISKVSFQTLGYGLKFVKASNRTTSLSSNSIYVAGLRSHAISNTLAIRSASVSNGAKNYAYQTSYYISNQVMRLSGIRANALSNVLQLRIAGASNRAVFWSGERSRAVSNIVTLHLIAVSNDLLSKVIFGNYTNNFNATGISNWVRIVSNDVKNIGHLDVLNLQSGVIALVGIATNKTHGLGTNYSIYHANVVSNSVFIAGTNWVKLQNYGHGSGGSSWTIQSNLKHGFIDTNSVNYLIAKNDTMEQTNEVKFFRANVLEASPVSLHGIQTNDGMPGYAGESIFLIGQSDPKENFIWVMEPTNWYRLPEANSFTNIAGSITAIVGGSAYVGTFWRNQNSQYDIWGTTPIYSYVEIQSADYTGTCYISGNGKIGANYPSYVTTATQTLHNAVASRKVDWSVSLTPMSMNIPNAMGVSVISTDTIGGLPVGEVAHFDDTIEEYMFGQFPVESGLTGSLKTEINGFPSVPDAVNNQIKMRLEICMVTNGIIPSSASWNTNYQSTNLSTSADGSMNHFSWSDTLTDLGISSRGCLLFYKIKIIHDGTLPYPLAHDWKMLSLKISAPRQ